MDMNDSGKMATGAWEHLEAPVKIGNFTPKAGFRAGKICELQT
jgi:hypothetical protein